jgi:hypothetical protein
MYCLRWHRKAAQIPRESTKVQNGDTKAFIELYKVIPHASLFKMNLDAKDNLEELEMAL